MLTSSSLPSPNDPDSAFAAVVSMKRLAAQLELSAVRQALNQGWTYAEIAQSLGVTKQAVHKKYARLFNQS